MSPPIDRRAVSPVFGYALTLTITTLLVGGLMMATGTYVDAERTGTAESELRVVGEQVSADISAVDRLARTDGANDIAVKRTLPSRAVGYNYAVEVRDDGAGPTSPYLYLSTTRGEAAVAVGIASKTDVSLDGRADGGAVVVVYENGEVVVRNG